MSAKRFIQDRSHAARRYDAADVARRLHPHLAQLPEVRFAFLHGSVLDHSEPADIDVGVWLESLPSDRFDAECALSLALSREATLPIDVQILNGAPIGVLHQVFRGRLVFARDHAEATDRIEQVAEEYLAFSHHIADYLDAVTT